MDTQSGTGASSAKRTLSDQDWVEAAIQALLTRGPSALRIASLARSLGVTPASFYWHFRSRGDLRDRVLRHWREKMLRRAASAAKLAGTGDQQLRALPKVLAARELPRLDRAMRAWAEEDAVVATAVASADELRLRVMTNLFEAAGLGEERALDRAKLLSWAFRGSAEVEDSERAGALRELIEALLYDAE